jgi:large subunit ribosomal protein L54
MASLLRIASEASTSGGLFSSLLTIQTRSFRGSAAAFAKAKPKKGGGGPVEPEGMSVTHCSGLNFKKGGEDPALGADETYPEWLWELLTPKKTLTMLEKEVAAAKLTGRYDVMDLKDVKRLLKLRRRVKIKSNNAARAK